MQSFSRLTAALTSGAFAVCLCGGVLASEPAHVTQSESLAYKLMLGGLHVGDVLVALNQDSTGYTASLKMSARGVAKWLREFRADLTGVGAFATGGADDPPVVRPATYRRAWVGAEVGATTILTYDRETGRTTTEERYVNAATGVEIRREDLPWNRGERDRPRPQVPEDMRAGALDPMAAFVAVRQQLLTKGTAATSFRMPIYDGQRRYDIVGKTSPPRIVTINGQAHNVMTVETTIVPVFGFTPKGIERMRESRGRFLFTADARFIPVQVTIENEMLSGVLNLTADCKVVPDTCNVVEQQAALPTN